MSKQAEIN